MVEELQSRARGPPKRTAAASRSTVAAPTSAGPSAAGDLHANLPQTPKSPAYKQKFGKLSKAEVKAKLELYAKSGSELDVSEANASAIQSLAMALGDPDAAKSRVISTHQEMSMRTFTELLDDPCSFYNVLSYSNHGRSDTPHSVL